jgi:hypothetical protein
MQGISTIEKMNFSSPYVRFIYAINSLETKKRYSQRFKTFLDFVEIRGSNIEIRINSLYHQAIQDSEWLQNSLIDFIISQKERVKKKEIDATTISNYYKPVKLFCDMNNILLNWKLISKVLPKGKHAADDRAPTMDEITKLLQYPDIRIKPIVLLMVSSGIRIGAWDYLKWKHITPIYNDESLLVAAKVIVYAGEPEQHFTFITSESYNALKAWIDCRVSYGEKVTGESWVMRSLWKTTNIISGARSGSAINPVKLKSEAIRTILCRALVHQNIRTELKEGERRHEFKAAHGFRKFFKTQCENVMKPANVELLMGHDLGISKSYYKPKENEILEDYLKAADLLTINEENKLKREVKDLKKKNKEKEYLIQVSLLEKDREVEDLKRQDKIKEEALLKLSDQVMILMRDMQTLKDKDIQTKLVQH